MFNLINIRNNIIEIFLHVGNIYQTSTNKKMGCNSSIPANENLWTTEDSVDATFTEGLAELNKANRNVMSWIPNDSSSIKGVIYLSHGLHEHGRRYYKVSHSKIYIRLWIITL